MQVFKFPTILLFCLVITSSCFSLLEIIFITWMDIWLHLESGLKRVTCFGFGCLVNSSTSMLHSTLLGTGLGLDLGLPGFKQVIRF